MLLVAILTNLWEDTLENTANTEGPRANESGTVRILKMFEPLDLAMPEASYLKKKIPFTYINKFSL